MIMMTRNCRTMQITLVMTTMKTIVMTIWRRIQHQDCVHFQKRLEDAERLCLDTTITRWPRSVSPLHTEDAGETGTDSSPRKSVTASVRGGPSDLLECRKQISNKQQSSLTFNQLDTHMIIIFEYLINLGCKVPSSIIYFSSIKGIKGARCFKVLTHQSFVKDWGVDTSEKWSVNISWSLC